MKHYHFMGISGVSMSALAWLLLRNGHRVTGCDLAPSELAYRLEGDGALILRGHSPDHLEGVDVLVASTAIPDHHPELAAARARGIPVLRRIELLGEILAHGRSIGVTGTHGKTTTTSMLGAAFIRAGQDPMVLVGGEVADLGGNARHGEGPYRIAEVDESDPLFQHLQVDTALLTNLEDDHVAAPGQTRQNYHESFEALVQAARRFAERAGRVVYNADWALLEKVTAGLERVGFGLEHGAFRAEAVDLSPEGSRFRVVWDGTVLGEARLRVLGLHNVVNALGVIATSALEGLDLEAVFAALAEFRGAHRRFERVGEINGAWVVDDYAHHPTEVTATLQAARATGRRVRVVFQPHRYLRTLQMWERFAEALRLADEAVVLEVYAAGEAPIEGVSGRLIAERLQALGHPARFMAWEEAQAYLTESARANDLILTMGAGDVWRLGVELARAGEGA